MGEKKDWDYIAVLNVVSMIAVVFMHTNGCFWTFSQERYWATANVIECLFYFAVPIFFMISGITLLDYRERYSTKTFLEKRIKKTFIPFLGWSVIGLILCITVFRYVDAKSLTVASVIGGIWNNSFIRIYWYFIPLFIVYLSIPLLSAISRQWKKSVYLYAVVVGFIVNSILPFLGNFYPFNQMVNPGFIFNICSNYILLVLMGYLLSHFELSKRMKGVIYALAIGGFLLHLCGTYIWSMRAGSIVSIFKGYENVPCVLYSVDVFILLKDLTPKIRSVGWLWKLIHFIKGYTFEIYLLHWFFLAAVNMFLGDFQTAILYRIGLPFLIIPLCIGVTWLLRKIPVIKCLVP